MDTKTNDVLFLFLGIYSNRMHQNVSFTDRNEHDNYLSIHITLHDSFFLVQSFIHSLSILAFLATVQS